jgi:UDP-glucose 4-epimerase
MKLVYVTGGAGFVGSNLCENLIKLNYKVVALDNLKTGRKFFLKEILKNKNFKFIKIDLKKKNIEKIISKNSYVVHLSANADLRFGIKNRFIDLEENIKVTQNILEACIKKNVRKIIFSSTGSVYGEAVKIPTPENYCSIQTSLYANSKNCCEGLITTYNKYFNLKYTIFRFVSCLGQKYTHGHVIDFCKKLIKNPYKIKILGNGKQLKSYMHVDDCCNAIIQSLEHSKYDNKILNLGTKEWISVNNSLKIICSQLKIKPKVIREKNNSGWPGDNPKILLCTKKINKLGWVPKRRIKESIIDTVNYLLSNTNLLK